MRPSGQFPAEIRHFGVRTLGVFRFSLLKNRDVAVGVLLKFEEVLERLFGFRRIAGKRAAARHAQIRERIELPPVGILPGSAPIGALVIHDFLELSRQPPPPRHGARRR